MFSLILAATISAQIHNVVDGDTMDMILQPLPTLQIIERVRVYGVDTPELNSPKACERRDAKKAEELVSQYIGKDIFITPIGVGKYGRLIAQVYVNGDDLADILIDKGLGVLYLHGRRKPWICN